MKSTNANLSQPTAHPVFLSERELSARWGVSIKKLQSDRLYGRGCEFFRNGRSVRYSMDAIIAYEKANTVSSTSEVSNG